MKRNGASRSSARRGGLVDRLRRLYDLRRMDRDGYPPDLVAECMQVHDRGSDVTVVAIAGMGVLQFGIADYEFRRLFTEYGADYNLVFVRDIRRLLYHIRPDGGADGLSFFANEIRQILTVLGSHYNVLIGTSGGGAAALYFGARLGVDRIFAFSPVSDARIYAGPGQILRAVLNAPRLFREPQAYAERLAIALAVPLFLRRFDKFVGHQNIWDVIGAYASVNPRPKATIYFGAENEIDARVLQPFAQFEEVKLIPVPTGVHNTTGLLRNKGALGKLIVDELRANMNQVVAQPEPSR